MSKKVTDLCFIFVAKTDKAICVTEGIRDNEGKLKNFWLPLSQIEVDLTIDYVSGDEISITMPLWLANEKGLI